MGKENFGKTKTDRKILNVSCIRGTGNLIRFKPSYDYRGWSSGRLSMIIFSRNAFHTPLQLQYYSRKIQVHSYGILL